MTNEERKSTIRDAYMLIYTYVPEASVLNFMDALELAWQRDEQAAEQLRISWELGDGYH